MDTKSPKGSQSGLSTTELSKFELTNQNMITDIATQERNKIIKRAANDVKNNNEVMQMLNNSVNQKITKNGSFNRLFSPR